MIIEEAKRLKKLPVYVFARLDELKEIERKKGADLIDLGMGNPDVPPPAGVIKKIKEAVDDPEVSRYPLSQGAEDFRTAVSKWVKKQYQLNISPQDEVATLIGSKEGLIHFSFAFVDAGDLVMYVEPAYPAHFNATILSGGTPFAMPTTSKDSYLPDFDKISAEDFKKTKIMVLSYPTNPTAAFAPREIFEKAVSLAKKYNFILLHDFAYAEIYFDGNKPISCLSIPGAKEVCIEFHSLSKTFGMAGWRCGFAVGNESLIKTLRRIKTNLDYGLFRGVQIAAIEALSTPKEYIDNTRATYQKRRDIFVEGINSLGSKVEKPKGSMYVWIPVPRGTDSTKFSIEVLGKTGIVLSPGTAFGALGEGYVRAALVTSDARIKEAIDRLKKANIRFDA
ncbi:MAG: LL-diaminopimelate aminotransferase apoenzyme [Candidatus Saganbacteria bacterium]|uniref:LL-diaminopimelate aminotransferase apoenzyme n=1 Tax=Candidatus Saganbacteria bacterium TaxID=2575572 RepID=A0A833P3E2_UNCSA|nr:MAG: LL-diaminopimelate aminotransferase apoenzyme [Candidatus Saganbacteria bacterium]